MLSHDHAGAGPLQELVDIADAGIGDNRQAARQVFRATSSVTRSASRKTDG